MRGLLGLVNIMVGPSEFVKEKYVEFGLDSEKITVISPGVDIKTIRSTFKPVDSDRLRFGYFGGNSELRGISDVLDAFHTIKDPSVELVLAGRGLNDIPPEYLPPNSRVIGKYSPEDVGRMLSEIDVLIIPSRCHESYNLLAREAGASGIPIIISDLRAQSDALQDGAKGLSFKAGQPADLAAKVLLLRKDAKLFQSLKGRAAEARSIEQTAAELHKLCGDLVRATHLTTEEMERQLRSFLSESVDRMDEERKRTADALSDELNQARTELLAIEDSFGYRVVKSVGGKVDRLFPVGTRRGEFRKALTTSLLVIAEKGIAGYFRLAWEKIGRREFRIIEPVRLGLPEQVFYDEWIIENTPSPRLVKDAVGAFRHKPRMSIIMTVYDSDPKFLNEAIESVEAQLYENWELCVCDDGSTRPEVKAILEKAARNDNRIRLTTLSDNKCTADGANTALTLVNGEFAGFLDSEDKLYPDGLYEVVKLLNLHPELDYVYTDEDKLDVGGRRVEPYFKPDWSPDLLLSTDYVGQLNVYRSSLLRSLGGLRGGFGGREHYDLVLRATEKTDRIGHVTKVVYGRRTPPSISASETAGRVAYASAEKVLKEAVARRAIKAQVEMAPLGHRVRYEIKGKPLVTIIIPARTTEYIADCITSIRRKTSYDNYEIIVVDRTGMGLSKIIGPSEELRFMVDSSDFNFSRLNNEAAKSAKGDYLVFLNDDTDVISGEWLSAMLEHAQREDVGAVGAKLLRVDGTVQHAGIIVGIQDAAQNYGGMAVSDPGYFGSASLVKNCTAVTGACMMVQKDYFIKMGRFDETLGHSWNDVDFGIRVVQGGRRVIYTPFALLYHYAGGTRGERDESSEELRAKAIFRKKNIQFLRSGDPFYNPNLSTQGAYLYLPKCDTRLLSAPKVAVSHQSRPA